jgi:polyphosphate kinase
MFAKDCPLTTRELSWLEFNQRVLAEADDPSVPLLERLFFLSIVASNLDEFFMVRVGGLHLQCAAGITCADPSGLPPAEMLRRVRVRVRRQVEDQNICLNQKVLPGLAARQVVLTTGVPPSPEELRLLDPVFESQIYPVLTPVALADDGIFPLLAPLANYLAVQLAPAEGATAPRRALIRLGPELPRVWRVPGLVGTTRLFVMLEDIVRAFLPRLLPGQKIEEAVVFRVTRNADMPVDEEFAPDLATAMMQLLRERRTGPCVRLEIERAATAEMAAFLGARLAVADEDVFRVSGPVDLTGLRELRALAAESALGYPKWTPQQHPQFDPAREIFEQMARQDLLLATPYESFDPVLKLVESAAADPHVRAIKIVLYRTGAKGALVRALTIAARSGKHVTALIELKARFDEARNIDWARGLEEAGVQVVYGVRNLKTHAKVCLVIRRENEGVRHYLHFGTGNYNESTAKLYTDVGLLTCDPALGRDATVFFHAVTGFSEPQTYQKLVQAPNGLRDRLLELIRFEAEQAENRQPAQILAKMNSLADPELIAALYAASRKGVEIRLTVRGICCLRPGVKGVSENITVTSVVDRFLEHSRIFYFQHGGQEELFLSSADWMPRNLDRRIELMVPVQDPACRRRLLDLLNTSLADNVKAWRLLPDGAYERVQRSHGQRAVRSQTDLCERAAAAARQARKAARTVFEPHLPPGASGADGAAPSR